MSAFAELMEYVRTTQALREIAKRTSWDQQTMMPKGAAPQRAEEIAAIQTVLHARRSAPEIGEWLEKASDAQTDPVSAAQLRLIRFQYERNTKMPADLSAEVARITSLGQGIWAEARGKDDFAAFAPTLKEIVKLTQEQADVWADGSGRYTALLQDYEPGSTEEDIAGIFDAMRPRLVALHDAILGADQPPELNRVFDEQQQIGLARKLAENFGYDFHHGRIDKVVHPFMSGSGLDVRVTTRTDASNPFDCLYSTIHEVGHAAYEQNIDPDYRLTPLGRGVSMGVHESQSRFYENQLGRSRAFTSYLYDQMVAQFGDLGLSGSEEFYRVVNRVSPGYIRTEADEIHYNLHIMLRFDLERDLVSGALEVDDLEEAWNARFLADFGQTVDKASNGVLQDVHWSAGAIGYFPTYALGNVYAGCLYKKMLEDVDGLEASLQAGDPQKATKWLRDAVQTHGGLSTPKDTIARACGHSPDEKPLMDYLEAKYADLYNL